MYDLINTFPQPAIVIDKNFTIINVNESGLVFLGINLSSIVSKKINTIFPSLDCSNLSSNSVFEVLYRDLSGREKSLSIKYCNYLKDAIYGIFYINTIDFTSLPSRYINKKTKLIVQRLNVFESLSNQTNQGIFVFNENGQLLYLNKIAANRFELNNKIIKEHYFWQLFNFYENKSQWDATRKKIKTSKEIVHITDKLESHSNKTRVFIVIENALLIENVYYYLVTFTDITAIDKGKLVIRDKDNHLDLFHKNIRAAIFEFVIIGKSSYFRYISNNFKNIFDFEIEINDLKWNSEIKLHPDDFLRLITIINEIKKNNSELNFTGRFVYKGKVIWFEINATIVRKKELILLNGIIININEKKINEKELINNRKFRDFILYNIPADIAVFDENHNYLFINSNGIANNEIREWMIGKNDFDYCKLKGLDTKMAEERRSHFIQAKESRENVGWTDEIIKADKKTYIHRKFYPIYNNNEFIYMIGYGVDITTLKETQQLLELQNTILTKKNQELERFTQIASHDLQEPLLTLISLTQLLEQEYNEILDNEGKIIIQYINNSASRMRSLITGLMEYTRINKKEVLDYIDFNILIEDVKKDLNFTITKSKAIIISENLPILTCYPTFIKILFQNLISNAIKFIHKDSLPSIKISCLERESDWLFKVADNGIGINEKKLEEIFLIYKRLHQEEKYSGLGVGLAHCKKIVEIHNGNIWAESTEGKGSVFYFTISKNI